MHCASSATIQGVRTQLVANSQGRFVDPRTGQGFSLEEIGGTSAGHGFTQVDFVHVDAAVCVGVVTTFGMDAFTSAVTTLSTLAFVSDGGQCAEFWIDPAALARMPESSSFERSVLRGEEFFQGRLLQVQRTRGATQNGAFQHAYSSASGFLLIASSSVVLQVVTLSPNNTCTPATGSTILTYSELRGVRHVANPALGAPRPSTCAA